MAHGSCQGLSRYVKRCFGLRHGLVTLTDARRDPDIPIAHVTQTWQWGFFKQLPSTEEMGELLMEPRWRRKLLAMGPDGQRSLARRRDRHGRWLPNRHRHYMGSPDTMARALEALDDDELHQRSITFFKKARRAKILDEGPFGQRCVVVDLNELFCSEKRCCPRCQQRTKTRKDRDGNTRQVTEYYHQAVLLLWAGDSMCWPIDWELLEPGEGELTASLRLLERVLPQIRRGVDVVLGDALYNCRPFYKCVLSHGLDAVVAYGNGGKLDEKLGSTEMDREIEEHRGTFEPQRATSLALDIWQLDSEAWQRDLRSQPHPHGVKLRVVDIVRHDDAPAHRQERRHLRVVTTLSAEEVPARQLWDVGRGRWCVENEGFNTLTSRYALEHNYHHEPTAILALLMFRGWAMAMSQAYRNFACARSRSAPRTYRRWFQDVFVTDWVRWLDEPSRGQARARSP